MTDTPVGEHQDGEGFAPWAMTAGEVLRVLRSRDDGLSTDEARDRAGAVAHLGRRVNSDWSLIRRQFKSPIVVLLVAAASVSAVFDEYMDSAVIITIVLGSGMLGWLQERGAVRAIDALLTSVRVHVDAQRDGGIVEVAESEVVPGDVVVLDTGDVVPGDCRVIEADSLHVDESVLTGESLPREKSFHVVDRGTAPHARTNMLMHGSHVVSGRGRAVVIACGADTEFGRLASHVDQAHVPTSFERGVARYGRMLAEVTGALVVLVFAVNVARGQPWLSSVLFSLALAVGITPQMLPVIVTTSLASGARLLARHKVVVKRLDSIEDIGSIDTLCVDKTGTLTTGTVTLVRWCDASGRDDPSVLELASWNARLQRGFRNPIDDAIIAQVQVGAALPSLVSEVPFDFMRRMISVVVEYDGGSVIITKGDVNEVLSRCRADSEDTLECARTTFSDLSTEGYRVLAVASRHLAVGALGGSTLAEERNLRFVGFLAFDDPVKDDVADAVTRLAALGIAVKVITGDNRLTAGHVARRAGIVAGRVAVGVELSALDADGLARVAADCCVFAEVDPLTKERLVKALSASGRTVGFLGDGVNDAAALHVADVGISVDSGVDVAKRVADIVLLEKDLTVLADAVRRGRRVFANTLTYVKVTTSANFGNMVSLAVATTFLADLPLLPLQILLLNFLSDIPGVSVAADVVEPERLARPGRWDVGQVSRFMIVFGLVSTAADLATFAVLLAVSGEGIVEVRTGWFAVSLVTEVAALLMLRTSRSVWRSRPGVALSVSSMLVVIVAASVPFGVLPDIFGFVRLDVGTTALLVAVVAAYVVVTETVKDRTPTLISGANRSVA